MVFYMVGKNIKHLEVGASVGLLLEGFEGGGVRVNKGERVGGPDLIVGHRGEKGAEARHLHLISGVAMNMWREERGGALFQNAFILREMNREYRESGQDFQGSHTAIEISANIEEGNVKSISQDGLSSHQGGFILEENPTEKEKQLNEASLSEKLMSGWSENHDLKPPVLK
ncbi:hypothetical protein KI387_023145, partial [Taxus chinensis]